MATGTSVTPTNPQTDPFAGIAAPVSSASAQSTSATTDPFAGIATATQPPAAKPSLGERFKETSGVQGILDSGKAMYDQQKDRTQEDKAVSEQAQALVKSGDYARAAELLIGHTAKRTGQALTDPIVGAVKTGAGIVKNTLTEAGEVAPDLSRGDYMSAAGHAIKAVPVVGPAAAQVVKAATNASEDLSKANYGAAAGDVLGAAATIAPFALGEGAADSAADAGANAVYDSATGKIIDIPKGRVANVPRASAIDPKDFTYREETPAPQHGTPVKVASPLDNPTIVKSLGGKDLSPEGLKTLKQHVGGTPGAEIEVGSTPKNTLYKAVGPVQKTLQETGVKVARVIADAPEFEKSTIADPSSTILKDLTDVRDNLPLREDDPLNKVVDKQLESAYPALESTSPQEILSARRVLGGQIDWSNITNSPETAGEVKNLTQAKIYHALGNKLHAEIPETAALDKVFQPNLELQSHLDAKLGEAVSRDPVQAEADRLSELNKGKAQLANQAHNEIVDANRRLAGLDTKDVQATVGQNATTTPVTNAIDDAVSKFTVPANEQTALQTLLRPNIAPGRVFGTNTKWYDTLKDFDKLTPQEQGARFSDPAAVRDVIRAQAKKQFGMAVVKYGSILAASHALGIDRTILHVIVGGL